MKKSVTMAAFGTVLALAVSSPSHAIVGGGADFAAIGTNAVTATVTFQGVLTGTNSMQVTLECVAGSVGAAASTAITRCNLSSAAGGSFSCPLLALPGNAGGTACTGSVALGKLTACVTGVGRFIVGAEQVTAKTCASSPI